MKIDWKNMKVKLVIHQLPKRKRRILLAEFSKTLYQYICQLYQIKIVDSTPLNYSFGAASLQGAQSDE